MVSESINIISRGLDNTMAVFPAIVGAAAQQTIFKLSQGA